MTVFGAVYISFTMNFFYPLRLERGALSSIFSFAVIFLGDTGAYLFGRAHRPAQDDPARQSE